MEDRRWPAGDLPSQDEARVGLESLLLVGRVLLLLDPADLADILGGLGQVLDRG